MQFFQSEILYLPDTFIGTIEDLPHLVEGPDRFAADAETQTDDLAFPF